MKVKQLKILEFSDIHLGHPNTTTLHILENLNKTFTNSPSFGEFDIVFIAGDVFDRLLNLHDPNVAAILFWINKFLRICKKYDVMVKVLEGTPSHDWKQSRYFVIENEKNAINADVEYIETLSIRHIDKFGIDVLYVPDEWNPECDDTWKEVQGLLTEQGLDQVDFSIMHGAFDYQLPSHIPSPTHIPERYLGITKYLVFIGHIHKHTVNDRIVSAGSFDRLSHGEEEPKGHVEVIVRKDKTYEIVFVPNEGAKVHKTINCSELELTKAIRFIERKIKSLPEGSFVRIQADKTNSILANLNLLRDKFPDYKFSGKVDKDKESNSDTTLHLVDTYTPINITKDNIEKLMAERMLTMGYSALDIEKSMVLLKEHI